MPCPGSPVGLALYGTELTGPGSLCRIAASLAAMQPGRGAWPPQAQRHSQGSSNASSGVTSSAGVTAIAADSEAVRLQLANLLQRRSANDMQVLRMLCCG